jgi:hypothetical protein
MANRAPVSHRKQRRRPQASQGRIRITGLPSNRLSHSLCLCGNERVTTADKLRIRRDRTYRNRPSTGDTMNDPTKQDDKPALCVKPSSD